MYWIHLSTAQDAGLEFRQTGSHAIITYRSVPKECVVKVVSESGKKESFARQLTPRERSKVTLRPTWVREKSKNARMQACTGKPRVYCRRKTLTQIHQGVAIGRKRSSNNLLIRVDGIPNDETYRLQNKF